MSGRTLSYRLVIEGANGISYTIPPEFSLQLEINRNAYQGANSGGFQIYNLSENIREAIRKDWGKIFTFRKIELQAGYGNDFGLIFTGNIQTCQSYRDQQASSFVTTIDAYDAGYALQNTVFNKSYNEGTSYGKITTDVIKSLPQVSLGAIGATEQLNQTIKRGNPYSDKAANILGTFAPGLVFIDNGKANVLANNEVIDAPELEISAATGLLGTPIRQETKVLVEIIFNPKVRVGQKIMLKTTQRPGGYNINVDGEYKVLGVHHSGMISPVVASPIITKLELLNVRPFFSIKESSS